MSEPAFYLAYEPDGPGFMCAVMTITEGENVFGWYTGPQNGRLAAAFFMLERYYTPDETVFYRSLDDDVYGEWVADRAPVQVEGGSRSPLPEPMMHELERTQNAFVSEWLFYVGDAAADIEAAADTQWYRARNLPLAQAGIHATKLNKLEQAKTVWIYASPSLDLNVIDYLRKRWPLDYSLAP